MHPADDIPALLWRHENGFVLGGRGDMNVRDWIRFHGARNQIVRLCRRVDPTAVTHDDMTDLPINLKYFQTQARL